MLQGKLQRNGLARLIRDGVVIYSGKIASLRRFKDSVAEVERGNAPAEESTSTEATGG